MKLLKKLDSHLLTALIVFIIGVVGFAITSFLLNTKYLDIPLGFVLFSGIVAIIYVISHLLLVIDKRRGTSIFSLVAITLRLFVMVTVLLLFFLLYYRWNIKLFNIFVLIGMYSVGVIVFLLINALNKGKE